MEDLKDRLDMVEPLDSNIEDSLELVEPLDSDTEGSGSAKDITLAVFLGGCLGGLTRTLLCEVLVYPILFVNITGAFLLGFLLEYLSLLGSDTGKRKQFRMFFGTGFMGAYTTYGTFISKSFKWMTTSMISTGLFYIVFSLISGFAAGALGIYLARKIGSER